MWKTIPSNKTTNLTKVLQYFTHTFPHFDKIFQFHLYKNFRGLNFRSYCRSKATLTKICKEIVDNKKTLVGFGDFSQNHGLVKKHPTAPIKRFKNELRKYCDLIEIDEYRTSKTCHKCHREITLYKNIVIRKNKDGTYKQARMSEINSVIRCSSNECSLCCMDRDINASKNILLLLQLEKEGKARPVCFLPQNKNNYDTPKVGDK
jgi:hypothetical protein